MKQKMEDIANAVLLMEQYLKENLIDRDGNLQEKKLWENTFIKKQIDKREDGGTFELEDHIRAIVYSMLSAGIKWERLEKYIDEDTSRITVVDEIFHQYNPEELLQCDPSDLRNKIKELHCATQLTYKQMEALIDVNIKKLVEIEKQYGSVDMFYQQYIDKDPTLKKLVRLLSDSANEFKLKQMGVALVAEYFRNVGYDIAKPDRHICRILGSDILHCSDRKTVSVYKAFDIVAEIAKELNKPIAEVDYVLWSYCADEYGEICRRNKCSYEKCVVKQYCEKE